MAAVFENDYLLVEVAPAARRIDIRRKPLPFQKLTDFADSIDGVLGALEQASARGFAVLYDAREAPLPGGATYMKAFQRMASELLARYSPLVCVVKDAAMIEAVRPYSPADVQFSTSPEAAIAQLDDMRAIS